VPTATVRARLCRVVFGLASAALLLAAGAASGAPWRFVVTGDSRGSDRGVDAAILGETARAVVAEGADFVLFTGDLVTGGCDEETFEAQLLAWQAAMAPVYQAGIGVYAVQGNHETGVTGSARVWNRVFSGPYAMPGNGPAGAQGITYAVAHLDVLVLALDQTGRAVDLGWVTAQLSGATALHRFVMGHYPAFKVAHADTLDDHARARDAFWRTLGRMGVRVYFTGHDHFFDHARIDDGDGDPANDVHQLVLGGGGAPLYSDGSYDGENGAYVPRRVAHDKRHGYAVVELDGPRVTITWKRRVAPGVFRGEEPTFTYEVRPPDAAPPRAE
jgi:hypothetical protein